MEKKRPTPTAKERPIKIWRIQTIVRNTWHAKKAKRLNGVVRLVPTKTVLLECCSILTKKQMRAIGQRGLSANWINWKEPWKWKEKEEKYKQLGLKRDHTIRPMLQLSQPHELIRRSLLLHLPLLFRRRNLRRRHSARIPLMTQLTTHAIQ